MSKRVRRGAHFMILPMDLHCCVGLFVVDTWLALDTLRLVCKPLLSAMSRAIMVQNIKVDIFYPREFARVNNVLSGVRSLQLHTLDTITRCPFSAMPSLRTLNVSGCGHLKTVQQLGDIPQVTALDLSFCSNLKSLVGLTANLKILDLTINCVVSDDLQPLEQLDRLEDLCLSFCNVTHLRALSALHNLQRLDLGGCGDVDDESLCDIQHLGQLRELSLMNCVKVSRVDSLATLKALQNLNLTNCHVINIRPLSALLDLQTLNVANCYLLHQLCVVPNLTSLNLNYCQAADFDAATLVQMSKLRELYLAGAGMPDLSLLHPLENLQTLHLSTCYRLTDDKLFSLHMLTSLTRLDLYECEGLTARGLRKLMRALPLLEITGSCSRI
jgi:hypothetical protein